MKRLLLLLAFSALAGGAAAQQYKWVDKDGRVRYGDVPPPGVKATPLRPPPRISSPAAAAPKDGKQALSPEAAFRKRQEESQKKGEQAAKEEQMAQAKRENCERAQEALRTLESGQRISRVDSKGERYFLEDAQIQQEAARARQLVQQNCGG
jgi:hypothetical protein